MTTMLSQRDPSSRLGPLPQERRRVALQRLALALVVLMFAFLFHDNLRVMESSIYDYTGLVYRTLDLEHVLLAYFTAVLPIFWMPLSITRPSHVAYWWLYLTVVLPSMFIPYHVITDPNLSLPLLPLTILAAFAFLGYFCRMPLRTLPMPAVSRGLYLPALMGVTGMLLVLFAAVNGLSFRDAADAMHELRIESRALDVTAGGYFVSVLKKCMIPFCLAVALGMRDVSAVFIAIVFAFLSFGISAEKTMLAQPVFSLGTAYLLWHRPRQFGLILILAVFGLLILARLEFDLFGSWVISSYGSRRVFYAPAQLTSFYWEYFSTHPKGYFLNGVVSRLLGESGDILNNAQQIGQEYFGTSLTNANANIWANGYADAGYAGVLLVTVLAGLVFRFVDGLARQKDFVTCCLAMSILGVTWGESAFQTSLFTSGVIPTLVLLAFLPNKAPRRPDTPVPRARPTGKGSWPALAGEGVVPEASAR